MPDFRGASVRKAAGFFLSAGIGFHVDGSGTIIGQFPKPGSEIDRHTAAVVQCENKSLNISGIF